MTSNVSTSNITPFGERQRLATKAEEERGPAVSEGPRDIVTSARVAPKDFATVAKEARAVLDQGLAKLGKPMSGHITGKEWDDVISSLDRRSLYAIYSNEGGRFSRYEQMYAEATMAHQEGTAMGHYDGLFQRDHAAGGLRGIRFLDGVSAEEKTSLRWAAIRAGTQHDYEAWSRDSGKVPEKTDGKDHPLVKILRSGLERRLALRDPTKRLEDMPEYQQAKQLAEQQRTQLHSVVDRVA
ncbi:hypothetical protein [Bradyrhizobium sp. SZCCHNS1054]|uniref:hypothetical protein n=1 Tax=Bradyrhizobium sp. SZCCHNS1054 TaxID=3057301 RepID=UPI002916972F|nr:hypothetical protein [Bradyrhizobium sp. SZCCHNS1054]